jgi:hypothetical protein
VTTREPGGSPRAGSPGHDRPGHDLLVIRLRAWRNQPVPTSSAASRADRGPREVVTTREPGGSPRAERIRAAVLSGIAKPHGPGSSR